MIKSIRTVLTPLLIISYVSGLKIFEFPVGHPRVWFSFSYMILFWSIYYFLNSTVISYFINIHYTTELCYLICYWLDILLTLLSVVFGIYHDKKFRNCLKKLDIVDNTLLNVGTITDYHKLHKKTMCLVLIWFLMIMLMNCGTAYWMKNEYNYDISTAMYILFIRNYCNYINMINDLIVASILGYIGLKFDQLNQHLLNLIRANKRGIKRAWGNSMHQHRSSQTSSNEWMTWIVIHLHLELRKISCEIDSIFGTQMTLKMGCNFYWLALDLRELFSVILINNQIKSNKILYIIMTIIWLCINVLKTFFFNYVCETISAKNYSNFILRIPISGTNATKYLIDKIPYSTYDVEVRENISQLLLQITRAPIGFYGIGLFKFGYTFLYGFSSSITTVVVLLIQGYINKQTF